MRKNSPSRTARLTLAAFLLLAGTLSIEAGPRENALELEKKGSFAAAVFAYEKWLIANPASPEFTRVLLHAADIHPDIKAAIGILEKYTALTADKEDRRKVLAKTAALCELSGDIAKAQKLFEQAYTVNPCEAAMQELYSSARLLFELGEAQRSEDFLKIITGHGKNPAIKKRAAFLKARLNAARGSSEEALRQAQALAEEADPVDNEAILLFIHSLAGSLNRPAEKEKALQRLAREYPNSPEFRIALLTPGVPGAVTLLPTPAALLQPFVPAPPAIARGGAGQTVTAPARTGSGIASPQAESSRTAAAGIQTGSFSQRENAEQKARDLRGLGFPSEVREGKDRSGMAVYKTLTPLSAPISQEDVQQLLIRLKDKGVEGFLVF